MNFAVSHPHSGFNGVLEQQDTRGPGLVLMENVWDILPSFSECVSVCVYWGVLACVCIRV